MKKFIYIISILIIFVVSFIVGGISMYKEMIEDGYTKIDHLVLLPNIDNMNNSLDIQRLLLAAKIAALNRELEIPLIEALHNITDLEEIEITIKIYENDENYNIMKSITTREIMDLMNE